MSDHTTTHPHKTDLPIGHRFIELQSVDSTNNYAMAQAHAGLASEGTVYFAHEQFAGKGQRGKSWLVKPGQNITMSVVLEPFPLSIHYPFRLSVCVAVSCMDFLSKYLPLTKLFIKWPNDLYWGDRKAGGLLIENSFKGEKWNYAILGIGININQEVFDKDLPNPVSLKLATGKTHKPVELAKELCACLNKRYIEIFDQGSEDLLMRYNRHLYKRGEWVTFKRDGKVFEAIIKEVDKEGRLHTTGREEKAYHFGELEWVIPGGPA